MPIGSNQLICQHAKYTLTSVPAWTPPGTGTATPIAAEGSSASSTTTTTGGGGGLPSDATSILVLADMVNIDELKNDNDYNELVLDMKDECNKYGDVISMHIPRYEEPGCGRVFVQYSSPQQAHTAAMAISARKFAGHHIVTSYCSEADYHDKKFA
jgi:splicing factor U2AF subunit